jgi:hypothetical protein
LELLGIAVRDGCFERSGLFQRHDDSDACLAHQQPARVEQGARSGNLDDALDPRRSILGVADLDHEVGQHAHAAPTVGVPAENRDGAIRVGAGNLKSWRCGSVRMSAARCAPNTGKVNASSACCSMDVI